MTIKIKKAYTGFIDTILLGKRAYIIELDTFGYEDKDEDVANTCASFSFVYIKGEDPFKQNEALSNICKKIQKLNPYTQVIIESNGLRRPSGMSNIKNVKYIINLKSKRSGIPFNERVNENSIKWFSKTGAFITFPVEDKIDLEEITSIMLGLGIKKHQIYINIVGDNFKQLAFVVMHSGFNIYIKYSGEWFEKKQQQE